MAAIDDALDHEPPVEVIHWYRPPAVFNLDLFLRAAPAATAFVAGALTALLVVAVADHLSHPNHRDFRKRFRARFG